MRGSVSTLDPLKIRRVLGRKEWMPAKPYQNGWWFDTFNPESFKRILVTLHQEDDGEWIHASISYSDPEQMPTYDDLKLLHQAIFPGHAYQVFVPSAEHINIRNNVLHLWGRADGARVLPDFGKHGTI